MEGTVKEVSGDLTSQNRVVSRSQRLRQVWSVGGGKGGIGKSLIASSLAISVARLGYKVIVIDLDLGGANLHTTLGIDLPAQSLSDALNRNTSSLEQCVVSSGISNLHLISGAQDGTGIANLSLEFKSQLLRDIHALDADYVILDLGAGTGQNTTDFFLSSDVGLLVILPEPTAIENAYRFIKATYYRFLERSARLAPIHGLIRMAMEGRNASGIRSPADLFRHVSTHHPESVAELKKQILRYQPKLIVNQTRTQADVEIGGSVRTVCKKYFGADLDFLGAIEYDSSVWQAVRRKRPLLLEFPNSPTSGSIERIAQSLLKNWGSQRVDLDALND